jgi:hypothetical protein
VAIEPGAVTAPAPVDPASVGYPRGYKVEVSNDAATWRQIAEGKSDGPSTTITFSPVQAKFVRITQTATVENAPAWSIRNLKLYGRASR